METLEGGSMELQEDGPTEALKTEYRLLTELKAELKEVGLRKRMLEQPPAQHMYRAMADVVHQVVRQAGYQAALQVEQHQEGDPTKTMEGGHTDAKESTVTNPWHSGLGASILSPKNPAYGRH